MTGHKGRTLIVVRSLGLAVALALCAQLVALGSSAVWSLPGDAWADRGPATSGDVATALTYCGALVNSQGDTGNTVHFSLYVEDGGSWPFVYQSGEYGPQASGCITIGLSVDLLTGGALEASHEAGSGTFGLEPTGTLTLTYGPATSTTAQVIADAVGTTVGVFTTNYATMVGAAVAFLLIVVLPTLLIRVGLGIAVAALRRVFRSAR